MLPISEFTLLYISYASAFLYFLISYLRTRKKIHTLNLVIFACYTSVMVFLHLDRENFRGHEGVVVLAFGFIFLTAHVSVSLLSTITEFTFNLLKRRNKDHI